MYYNYDIYVDGSAAPNPGQGGFGVLVVEIQYDDNDNIKNKEIIYTKKESCNYTTNNREEIKAMIAGCRYVRDFLLNTNKEIKTITIYSDSAYVVNICNGWIYSWYDNNWNRTGNKPIENLDLIKELYNALITSKFNAFAFAIDEDFKIIYTIQKVVGHNQNAGNELADALATGNSKKFNKYWDKVLEF